MNEDNYKMVFKYKDLLNFSVDINHQDYIEANKESRDLFIKIQIEDFINDNIDDLIENIINKSSVKIIKY